MKMENWIIRILLGVTAVAMLIFAGCSEGESQAAPECLEDSDCEEGWICDSFVGECMTPRRMRPSDFDEGDTELDPDPGPVDDVDAGDVEPEPEEDAGEEDPTPDADEEIEPLLPCAQEFDACDPETQEQGDFLCMEQDNGDGVCYARCDRPSHAAGCGVGSYCWEVDGASAACLPSECSSQGECSNGTCVQYDNSYGTCLEAGSIGQFQECVTGDAPCAAGLYCNAPPGETGECMPVCDPFAEAPCEDDLYEACSVTWRRSGVCTTHPYLDDELRPYYACSDLGSWCTHGVQCSPVWGDSFCLPYCRPGEGDCEPYPDGTPTICDNYWYPGDQSVGSCIEACTPGSCGGNYECVDQICRLPCPSGDPEVECCSEGAECEYQCLNGYCA